MHSTLPLSNSNQVWYLDDQDYEFFKQFSWRKKLSDGSDIYHVVRDVDLGDRKITIRSHRLITEARRDQFVVHLNHNGLDNRRRNLQVRTVRPWTGRPQKSGFRGVHQSGSGWTARIDFAGNNYVLGEGSDPRELALIYDDVARRLYGANAVTNF